MEQENNVGKIVKIPQYKKIWYSITKFEKYPEMATEGVGRAILYLMALLAIFAIIVSCALLYKFNNMVQTGLDYLDKNVETINYENGELSVNLNQDNVVTTDIGTVIVDTNKITDEKVQEYEKSITANQIGIIWLKDRAIVKLDDIEDSYEYKSILDGFNIKEFNKQDLIELITNKIGAKIYIGYFVIVLIILFISYFITTILDVLLLSIFGLFTSLIARIKMRYRAIFNMSIYAITLSIVLEIVYTLINMFTNFEISNFELMYTAIAYICLAAAIFMIKSDVIKQQIELMKIIEIKKKEEEERKEKEEQEKKEQEEKKEDKKENKEEEKKEKKENKEKEDLEGNVEGQGSNA